MLSAVAAAPWERVLPPGPLRIGADVDPALLASFAASAGRSAPLARYPGSTRGGALPERWRVCRSSSPIGKGGAAYARAAAALRALDCMQLGWLHAAFDGDGMAIASRQFGCVWLLNANRVLSREETPRACAVTWATTRRHVLAGEERLELRWDAASDDVVFSVLSFSRPRHAFSWLAYPYVCAQQARFARDAAAALGRAANPPGTYRGT